MTARSPSADNDPIPATAKASNLPELGYFVVVFADDQEDPGWFLESAVSDEYDEQDRKLGQDTYSVSLNGGVTVYGGVARWAVSGDVVSIRFRPDAARVLGVPEEINLVLELEGSDLRSVHQGLVWLLGPCD